MENKKRRRRKAGRISFWVILLLMLLMLLIPVLVMWYGHRRADRVVPDHATGYIIETTPTQGTE